MNETKIDVERTITQYYLPEYIETGDLDTFVDRLRKLDKLKKDEPKKNL